MASETQNVDFESQSSKISNKFYTGPNLIYDCNGRNWVCVDKDDYKACKVSRIKSIEEHEMALPCAPFDEFPTKNECYELQLKMVSSNMPVEFCYHDEYKKRFIRY